MLSFRKTFTTEFAVLIRFWYRVEERRQAASAFLPAT
jgi:hypothetical protein